MFRLGASIDKYKKEVSRIRTEESSRWAKRFKEAKGALDSLKEEILEKGMQADLEHYIQQKDVELENSKLLLKTMHVDKVNNVYQMELENSNKSLLIAIEIVQGNYLLLRSMGELDNSMEEKLQGLLKALQGQRNVKFAEEETADVAQASSTHPESVDPLHQIVEPIDLSDDESSVSATKRRPSNDDDLQNDSKKSKNSLAPRDDFQFLRPKAVKSINFDAVKAGGSLSNHDLNTTFDLHSGPGKLLSDRVNSASSSSASSASRGIFATSIL